jgi:hypothetical protein
MFGWSCSPSVACSCKSIINDLVNDAELEAVFRIPHDPIGFKRSEDVIGDAAASAQDLAQELKELHGVLYDVLSKPSSFFVQELREDVRVSMHCAPAARLEQDGGEEVDRRL